MTVHVSTAARNAMLNALTALLDAGSGPATIQLRTGTQPTGPGDAATGTLLTTWTLTDPAFGAAVDGVATLTTGGGITSTAVGSGTATWARAFDSTGAAVFDGDVGTSVGATFVMADPVVASGQTVILLAGTLTAPAA